MASREASCTGGVVLDVCTTSIEYRTGLLGNMRASLVDVAFRCCRFLFAVAVVFALLSPSLCSRLSVVNTFLTSLSLSRCTQITWQMPVLLAVIACQQLFKSVGGGLVVLSALLAYAISSELAFDVKIKLVKKKTNKAIARSEGAAESASRSRSSYCSRSNPTTRSRSRSTSRAKTLRSTKRKVASRVTT